MRIPLGKTVVPVRVLLMVRTMEQFTVNDAVDEFFRRHKIDLKYSRMKQILDDFTADGLLEQVKVAYGSKNKITAHYTFIPLPDGREQHTGEPGSPEQPGQPGQEQHTHRRTA